VIELVEELAVLLGSATARPTSVKPASIPQQAAARVAPLRGVTVVRDRTAFDAVEAEWRELEASAGGALLFQSYDWCRAVWDHHTRNGQRFEPMVVTLREQGRLVGLLPLQRVRSGLMHIATGFGEPYQQYSSVMLAPDAPKNAAERLLDAACRLGCDGLNLLKVRDDSPLAPLLAARRAIRSNEDAAPFVDLTPFADFKSYHATVNSKTRKNMRNARNRLGRAAKLEHRVLTNSADIQALVERAHAGRERWLAAQGLTSRAFRDPSFGAFGAALADPASGLRPLAMSLTLDGRPIADQWGLVFGNRYYAYVATWAPDMEEASPGKLHLEEVIRACKERGIGVADFLIPAARYKFTWTDKAMPVADYAIPLSLGAQLQFILWSGSTRPLLKRLALRLPSAIRSRAARLLLRR
jgi:CelD/BcsL family acetyltransferase involved in cellulose biosynthesis